MAYIDFSHDTHYRKAVLLQKVKSGVSVNSIVTPLRKLMISATRRLTYSHLNCFTIAGLRSYQLNLSLTTQQPVW